ncbi:MAG TPA: hypothetical protein VFM97_01350 [Gammaproteobacteria bacterium]|nr:hypothetical protein [Gammaproteobacteria bacterium]
MTPKTVKLIVAGVLLVYPLAIWFADGHLSPSELLAGLMLLLAARSLAAAWIRQGRRSAYISAAAVLIAGAALVLVWLPGLRIEWLRFYPMLFSLTAFAVFFRSLFTGMPLVERFARVFHPDLPAEGVRYVRRVTWFWSGVLLANALISFYTAVALPLAAWSLYNGAIVYVAFGGVFVGEYLVRTHLRRKWMATA